MCRLPPSIKEMLLRLHRAQLCHRTPNGRQSLSSVPGGGLEFAVRFQAIRWWEIANSRAHRSSAYCRALSANRT